MNSSPPRTYRYERKFLVNALDAHQVRALVKRHPGMFSQAYPPRYVNNLYLDTPGLENYHANLSGQDERQKVRIRWYGELFGKITNPVLEIKVKRGLVGMKYSYPFPPFTLDEHFTQEYFESVLRDLDAPEILKLLMRNQEVVLCNRYFRWYYAAKGQGFRATVDDRLSYYQIKRSRNNFLHHFSDDQNVILELKYPRSLELSAHRVAGFFPFIMTKNSKYVTGIERVCL